MKDDTEKPADKRRPSEEQGSEHRRLEGGRSEEKRSEDEDHEKGEEGEESGENGSNFSDQDVESIEERSRLRAPMIYEVLRREGEEEMDRPITSLWWSGVAAGLSISLSLLTQAILQSHLPDTPWRPLISGLGYTVGFLVAVLARHQLFTENTITAVLPLTADFSLKSLGRMGRLWGVVLIANFAGTFLAALFYTFVAAIPPELREAMFEISRHTMESPPLEIFAKAIAAGFLIAAMVWLLPNAMSAQFHVIVLMTYIVAIGGFAHIVAGSLEAFMLVLSGQIGVGQMLIGFVVPALIGNIIGGTLLFALISYGQVVDEI